MNPWAIVGALALWAGSLATSAWWFYRAGTNAELATQAREDRATQIATEAAASAAANAISHIGVRNVTINHKLEREVQTREVYRDCRSGMDAVQLLNATPGIAPAGPVAAASGVMPASGAAR